MGTAECFLATEYKRETVLSKLFLSPTGEKLKDYRARNELPDFAGGYIKQKLFLLLCWNWSFVDDELNYGMSFDKKGVLIGAVEDHVGYSYIGQWKDREKIWSVTLYEPAPLAVEGGSPTKVKKYVETMLAKGESPFNIPVDLFEHFTGYRYSNWDSVILSDEFEVFQLE